MATNLLRNIPSVNELLEKPALARLSRRVSRNVVVSRARTFLDKVRADMEQKALDWNLPSASELAEKIAQWIVSQERPGLRPVINATGNLLDPCLGRAPLAEAAIAEIAAIGSGYASLDLDLATGKPASRTAEVEHLLRDLTGAESALIVNNTAAAALLALAALSAGKETLISRGELVEIDGSFRLPEITSAAGARLKEVGATNKTTSDDYAAAIDDNTAALLKVSASDYAIVGSTTTASLESLAELARKRSLPLIHLASAAGILDGAPYGLPDETQIEASLQAGADLVILGGDRLLGGPQCGIVLGRKKYLAQLATHPLARALRPGKLTLAALLATVRQYRDPEQARLAVPVLAMLDTSPENLQMRAERLAPQLVATAAIAQAEPAEGVSTLEGGALPEQQLATWGVQLTPAEGEASKLRDRLRRGTPAVLAELRNDKLWFDLRTVLPGQDQEIVAACTALASPAEPEPETLEEA